MTENAPVPARRESNRPAYEVREVDPLSVADEVARIWGDNLSLPIDAHARFDWVYRLAPEPPERVTVLSARRSEAVAKVVGTAGVARRRFQIGSRLVGASQLVDLAVDAEHRSVGPALSLVRATRGAALGTRDFAYCFPNAKARGLFRRVGYRELGPVTRFARVLAHRGYLERLVPSRTLARVAGAALDAGARLRRMPQRLVALSRFELRFESLPDQRLDRLWERARCDYDVVSWRGARLLRWRFFECAANDVRLATLCFRGQRGSLLAYAVVERVGEVAHVRDFFGHESAIGPLFDLLIPSLRASGASSVSLMFLGSRRTERLLQQRGFSARERERILFFDSASPDLAGELGRRERWHVTDADDDG